MKAAEMPLEIQQGATFLMQFTFIENGKKKPLTDIQFVGEIKASVYDEKGYPFRFVRYDEYVVNVYVDAEVSESMDFKKGVYDIKMIQIDGFNTRLIRGPVTIDLGVTDETDYV